MIGPAAAAIHAAVNISFEQRPYHELVATIDQLIDIVGSVG